MRRSTRIAVVIGAAVAAVIAVLALALADSSALIALLLIVPLLGLVVAVMMARRDYETALSEERAARVRSEFVGRAGRLLEAPPEPQAMLEQIVRLAVPDMAELCTVDLVDNGELGQTVVHAADPQTAETVRAARARFPLDAGGTHPVAVVARTGRPHVQPHIGPERLRAIAIDEEHLQLLLRRGYASSMAVPLVARGRTIGVLSFLRFGEAAPYVETDADVASEVARRAALAFDNARLFSELRRAESQLEAVLGNLAAAVTVQARDGSLVYVNQAAAEMLGCASPDEVLVTPLDELLGRFVLLDELGQPLDLAALPGRRALAGEEPAPMLWRMIGKASGEERWTWTKATPVRDAQGDIALAVNVLEDVTDARLVERQQRFLGAASMLVSSSLDIDVTLDKVAWAAVPELADWCCVNLADERGVVRRAALAAADAERAALDRMCDAVSVDPDDPASPAHVLRTGRPLLLADFDERAWTGGDAPVTGTRSALVVPMLAGTRVTGLVTLGTSHSARRLGEGELALAVELGRRAGIAVENARVHAARSHIATTLQRSLLPPRLPVVPGLTIAARFRAAGESSDVGGDFYDLFPAGDAWMAVVGDVTGKGPAAAAITSLARYTMRTAAMYEQSPGAVLARLNEALAADADRGQLCTAVCARFEQSDDGGLTATIASGGHPPPYRVACSGEIEALSAPGVLLGAFDSGHWAERPVALGAGDALVFYTDGVTDTRGEDDERFGQERLEDVLGSAGRVEADELASRVDEALRSFERGVQRDDVAVLVLHCAGRSASRAS